RDGLRQIETTLVDRATDDRAHAAQVAHGPQVVDRADPARGDDLAALQRDEAAEQRQIGALQPSVPVDRRHLERRDPGLGERAKRYLRLDAGRAVAPALA